MTVARVTEITATSSESFDAALNEGVKRASKTLKNIKGAWVKEQEVIIEEGEISQYLVKLKVTFVLDD
jgi:flavin-binding protein dodecin